MRVRYVALLRALLPNGARILTITFDYDQSRLAGPPFSVPEAELRQLYDGADVQPLDRAPLTQPSGALTPEMGAVENCWLVTL